MTLGTYVLLRRFDEVVAAANVRLSVMSSGRYELASSDEREVGSRSRKTGLSLVIRDATTDTTRDPGSFSGGETFYASLSLALGHYVPPGGPVRRAVGARDGESSGRAKPQGAR